MNRGKKTLLQAGALLLSLLMYSCAKETHDFSKIAESEWNPSIAIPLVNSSLGISDLLVQDENSLIKADKDGLLMLTYQPEAFSTPGNDLIALPDQVFSATLATGNSIGNFLIDTVITQNLDNSFSYNTFDGVQVDSIDVKSGFVSFFIKSSFKHDLTIKIKLNDFRKNGVPLLIDIPILYDGSPLIVVNKKIDLSNYLIEIGSDGKIPYTYTTEINFKKSQPISSQDKLEITQTLGDFKFKGIYGYFGTIKQDMPVSSIPIGLFDNSIPGLGKFTLTNPKIKLNIENTIGIPIKGEIKTLETTDDKGNVVTSLLPFTGKDFSNPFVIPAPLSSSSEPGKLSIVIDNLNAPNLAKLLSSAPKNFAYGASIELNPNGVTKNFITENSKISITPELEIPLEGTAYGFSVSDTFNFPEINDSIIESLLIRANISNWFPINVRLQVTFLDQAYNKIDSLFSPGSIGDESYNALILSGKINADGKVVEPTQKITDIVYSKERSQKLKNAKFMVVRGELETTKVDSQYKTVKFLNSYKLEVKLGAQIQGKIKF